MEDTFGKIIAIFICVMQMFFIPLYIYNENIKTMEQTYILSEITYNVDNFRNTGIIASKEYEDMRNRIFSLSGNYNIIITHATSELEKEDENDTYFDTMYYNESVEDALSKQGKYYLQKNDYINICVEDKSGNIVCVYGGAVKYEAY